MSRIGYVLYAESNDCVAKISGFWHSANDLKQTAAEVAAEEPGNYREFYIEQLEQVAVGGVVRYDNPVIVWRSTSED